MRERARRRRVVGVVVALAVVGAAGGAAMTYSGVFGARTLIVRGTGFRSREEILATAGLAPGVNVFHLDTAGPVRALLTDPWIAEATVDTSLPSTVTVSVVERLPLVVTGTDVLAADGTVLPGAPAEGLPRILPATASPTTRAGAAAVVAALRPAERRALREVTIADDGAITLRIDTLVVRWGPSGEDAAKAAALAAVLRDAGDGRPAVIDVSVPGAPSASSG
jgi:cell division protein FtsQ